MPSTYCRRSATARNQQLRDVAEPDRPLLCKPEGAPRTMPPYQKDAWEMIGVGPVVHARKLSQSWVGIPRRSARAQSARRRRRFLVESGRGESTSTSAWPRLALERLAAAFEASDLRAALRHPLAPGRRHHPRRHPSPRPRDDPRPRGHRDPRRTPLRPLGGDSACSATGRSSFYLYNDKQDLVVLIDGIEGAGNVFGLA